MLLLDDTLGVLLAKVGFTMPTLSLSNTCSHSYLYRFITALPERLLAFRESTTWVIGVAVLLSGFVARQTSAVTFNQLVEQAFACGISESKRDGSLPNVRGKEHRIDRWGVSLWLPDRWGPLRVVADRQAEAQSPSGAVNVRVTMQPLGEMTLSEVIDTYENAYFGQNQAVGECREQLSERFRVRSADQYAVGMYRSTIPLRYWRSSYVVFAIVASRVVVLEVAANWNEQSLPPVPEIELILSGLSVK